MATYGIGVVRRVKRPALDGGGDSVEHYRFEPYYGIHATNIAAKRAYVEALEPSLRGASEEYIRRQFNAWSRNVGGVKVLSLPPDPGTIAA